MRARGGDEAVLFCFFFSNLSRPISNLKKIKKCQKRFGRGAGQGRLQRKSHGLRRKNHRLRPKNGRCRRNVHLYDLLDVLDLVDELHLCHSPDVLELPDRPDRHDHTQQKQKTTVGMATIKEYF